MKNLDPLVALRFYEQLSITKTDQAFKGYAMSYKVEIIERKDPIVQLEASKLSIKNLFSDLLNELKGLKYQTTVEVLLNKYTLNGEIEFSVVCFISVAKTVTNHVFALEKSFEEVLYMIDVWIKNGCSWIIELIESQYINISTYRPLSGSSYIDLPVELRSPRKRLINIKSKDEKCFLWCHVRHINLLNKHPERIKKNDKKIAKELNYDGIEFPIHEKDFTKIEIKYALMYLVTKMNWFFQFISQIKNLKIPLVYYF